MNKFKVILQNILNPLAIFRRYFNRLFNENFLSAYKIHLNNFGNNATLECMILCQELEVMQLKVSKIENSVSVNKDLT